MPKHVAEALVLLPNAETVAEDICSRSRIYCRSITTRGSDRLLDFGDGRAVLKPGKEGLFLRVEAHDLVTFYGIRTVLQGHLFATSSVRDSAIEWHPTSGVPFGADQHCRRSGRSNWPRHE